MQKITFFLQIILLVLFCLSPITVYSEKNEARLYTTREEKREAGIKHQLVSWLVLAGLAEFEWNWEKLESDDTERSDITDSTTANVQLSTFITPYDWLKSEIITEYDTDIDQIRIDEAEISLEFGGWELAFGKYFLPFGNFISHFSNGPLIEFGETRDETVSLSYNYKDIVDISIATYNSRAHKINSGNKIDWSASLEAWPKDYLSVGLSYLSDLADSEQQFLADHGHRYINKVPALSGYILWVSDNYEISFETLVALESFAEIDSERDQPFAFNLEYAYFFNPSLDCALRLEGSHELEDSPEIQFGFAVNYRVIENIVLTSEILHGLFKDDFVFDEADKDYNSVTKLGILLSIGF